MREDSFRLGRVDQLIVKNAIIKRLFAKPVAGKNEFFLSRVPESDGVHAVEVIDEIIAVLLVKVRNDLYVGLRYKLVALLFQFGADLAKVVQLAIDHCDDRPVLAVNWLVTGVQINDRKPPHAESGTFAEPYTLRVRPPMNDRLAH